LDCLLRLQRVNIGKARQTRDLLIEARVVLHRATAKREQPEVDRIILPRQARVVAHGFRLAEAGETDWAGALEAANSCGAFRRWSKIDAGLIGRADLEQQQLLKHQC